MSVLKAVNVKKSFPTPAGPLEVLRGVNLEIMPGECASIRGESGSGKTTLLQILGGLDSATSGDIFWNGERITKRGNAFLARARAKLLGYVFQAYHLVPELNAIENVLLAAKIAGAPMKAARKISAELLERVGLGDREMHLPTKLSGGECQRVAIARALVNRPPLILADEPTGNLDERSGNAVMTLLLEICREQKTALLLVTHNKEFAELADRKIFLKNGILEEIS
ncbi:MAG: ABC transporter ATP-binding protein [Opitutae bacterium]|nr:ABC transporter ATP-binding protein [Opitutae bacterium]MCD8298364.1 ABC transporter ATP-binding protein [Opitutae bacterium]